MDKFLKKIIADKKKLFYLVAGSLLIVFSSTYFIATKMKARDVSYVRKIDLSTIVAPSLKNDPLYKKYQEQEAGLEKIEKEVTDLKRPGVSVTRNTDDAGYTISYRPLERPQMSEEQREEFEQHEREKYAEIEGDLLERHHDSALPELDVEEEEMVQAFREQMKKGDL